MTDTERELLIALADAMCEANPEPKAGWPDSLAIVRLLLRQLREELT